MQFISNGKNADTILIIVTVMTFPCTLERYVIVCLLLCGNWDSESLILCLCSSEYSPSGLESVSSGSTAAAKLLQLCLTLCDPINGSPPGSAVPGILQARTLEWVAISFSNAWKWKVKVKSLSRVQLSATTWTAAYPAPPSMGFSRQEYWSGVPLPSLKVL